MILVDTSIWGRIASKSDKLHDQAMQAMQWAIRQDELVIAAQSIYEFWVVATRPIDKNGLGWTTERTAAWILVCQRTCRLLPDDARLFNVWAALVTQHATKGKPAHDARLVACMKVHGIEKLLTFNVGDFTRYGLTVIDPRTMK